MKSTMWRILIVILILPSVAITRDKIRPQKEVIFFAGKQRVYYTFAQPSSSESMPMILLLHGSGRDGMSQINEWEGLARKEGIILVAPNSANSAEWVGGTDGPEFLRDVIEAVQKKYPVDSRRLYLFGHSGGASFGMYMGMLESQYFAAVAVHAGTLQKDSDVFTFAQRKIPIAIWSGTLDQFFPLDQVRSTRDILNSHGFRAQLFEMPGHDHDYYQVAGEVNKEAWAFLKQNILDEEPEWRDIKWSR